MTLLIAEDDRDTRFGLKTIFEQEGYTVIAVPNGKEAVERFIQDSPDLVCLDIMMPEMSGYEACREIRKEDVLVPILFLSAKSEEIDKVLGLELGADDYISKPFGVREIVARVKALLRRTVAIRQQKSDTSSENTDPFFMDDLQILPEEMRAVRGEESIDLSPREVIILELLGRQPGKVVTRLELFNAGWGLDYIPNSRTLDQTVSQLRKKVEKNPARPEIIKTVHNAGYRYEG